LLVVASLVAGSLLGQPVLLSYVETGSMAPTMEPGKGFVAVPWVTDGFVKAGHIAI
jgi:signal peptidase